MIDGKNQLAKNDLITYENNERLQLVKYMIMQPVVCQIIFFFQNYYLILAIDLIKRQALDADPKEIQEINLTRTLDRGGQTAMFFVISDVKQTIFNFSQEIVRVL